MAFTKFVIQPKKPDPNQLLTSFQAPKTAATSYQTTAPEMVARQQATKKFLGSASNFLKANILGPTSKQTASPTTSPTYSPNLPYSPVGGVSGLPPTSKSSKGTQPFDNEAALAGLRKKAAEENALYESQQQVAGEEVAA